MSGAQYLAPAAGGELRIQRRGARSWRDPGLEVLQARRSPSQGAKESLGPRVAAYTRGAGPHPAHLWPQPHIPPKRGEPQPFTGGPDSSALGPSLPHPSYRGDEARRSFWANSTYFSSLSPELSPGEVGGVWVPMCLEKRSPRATPFPGGPWLHSPGPQSTWGPLQWVVLCLPPPLAEPRAPRDP